MTPANLEAIQTGSAPLAEMERVSRRIHASRRFLVTSHSRPDGDAVGSLLAFAAVLDQLGKDVDCVLADPVPQVYATLPGVERIRQSGTVDADLYDAAAILECDSTQRTGLQGYGTLPVINIDHHATGREYGSENWIDCDVSAVAVLVYRLAVALGITITPDMATCLYTAVFTDTGAFTYPGTAASALPIAQSLIALGARADAVAHDVLYSVSAASIRLLGTALSRMQVHGATAWSYVLQDDLSRLGATDEDSEGTVNYLISIAGIDAALFLREVAGEDSEPTRFRASLRSKSPSLDVSAIAIRCGGGGHRNAAGCTVTGPLQECVDNLLHEIDVERAAPPAVTAAT